jgi:hypothetical protein
VPRHGSCCPPWAIVVMLPSAMTDDTDDRDREERDARERLIDAEVEAEKALEEAEQLEEDATGLPEPQAGADEERLTGTD